MTSSRRAVEAHPDLMFEFRHSWWYAPRAQFIGAVLIGVLGIGGVWPFIVNLIAFGRLTHPPDEKSTIDLSKVANGSVAVEAPSAGL